MEYLRGTELVDLRSGNKAIVIDSLITKAGRNLYVLEYDNGGIYRFYASKLNQHFAESSVDLDNVTFVDFKNKEVRKAV